MQPLTKLALALLAVFALAVGLRAFRGESSKNEALVLASPRMEPVIPVPRQAVEPLSPPVPAAKPAVQRAASPAPPVVPKKTDLAQVAPPQSNPPLPTREVKKFSSGEIALIGPQPVESSKPPAVNIQPALPDLNRRQEVDRAAQLAVEEPESADAYSPPLPRTQTSRPWNGAVPPLPPDADIVQHAAGAVEFPLPAGWRIYEMPAGREVRLAIVPQESPPAKTVNDGIWLVYHVRPQAAEPNYEELERFLLPRLELAESAGFIAGEQARTLVHGRPALVHGFSLPAGNSANTSPSAKRLGFHLVVSVEWGICELHNVFPANLEADRIAMWEELVGQISFAQPRVERQQTLAATEAAAPMLGSWKGYRSRLRLYGNGRIVLLKDVSTRLISTEDALPNQPLTGTYEAQGDLLKVTWDDGSRLNFRWRLSGTDLLLTDHRGHISQMRRFLE